MLDRKEVVRITGEIKKALSVIPGVQFDLSGIRFSSDQISVKLTCNVGSPEEVKEQNKLKFGQDAMRIGLLPNHLNAEFKYQGEAYSIVGINLRKYKFPILAKKKSNGKNYCFEVSTVKAGLGGPKRKEEDILKDLRNVYINLSPENLTCDGELNSSQVAKRERFLRAEEIKLIGELGRIPTEVELK